MLILWLEAQHDTTDEMIITRATLLKHSSSSIVNSLHFDPFKLLNQCLYLQNEGQGFQYNTFRLARFLHQLVM